MTGKRFLKVFLSYAHADSDAVKDLYNRLKADGVDAWLDEVDLLPGKKWKQEIRKALQEADVVVVCLSCQYDDSGFRHQELSMALEEAASQPEGEIFIIPARLEECKPLESLEQWHWVDLFEKNGYEKLMRALQKRAESIGAELQSNKGSFSVVSEKPTTIGQTSPKKSLLSGQNKDTVIQSNDEFEKRASAQVNTTTESSAAPKTKEDKSKNIEYFAAIATLVGAIATIFAAILGFPFVGKWLAGAPTSTVTATYTASATFTPVVLPSDTFTLTATRTETATPTVEPTFTQTTTSTATLPPRPTDTVTITLSNTATPWPVYSCATINEQPPLNTRIHRGKYFKIQFRLVNTGSVTWPDDLELVIVSNSSEIIDPDPSPIKIPRVHPGDSQRITLDATAPYEDGRHVITFKLGDGICWPYVAFNVVK